MPITLGCSSCRKRFRARDESAGKRVKCPFCQAAVQVPTDEAALEAGAPTEAVAPPPPRSGVLEIGDLDAPLRPIPTQTQTQSQTAPPWKSSTPPTPAPVAAASADEWGAAEKPPAPAGFTVVDDHAPNLSFPTVRGGQPPRPTPPGEKSKERPARGSKPAKAADSPLVALAAGWRKARAGLGWVRFGLCFVALLGAVPFAKMAYERFEGALPAGEGWVKIDGYVNSDGPDAVRLSKTEEINILAYGVPVLVGGLALVLGRVTCGSAPRSSGAKGLYVFSGLAALVALTGLLSMPVCAKLGFGEVGGYARLAAVVAGGLGEFWFLLALGASAATLRRPAAVRAVGFFALVVGVAAVVVTAGWDAYLKYGPGLGVPRGKDPDWPLYESAAKMLGWFFVVGVYFRAVGAVKRAMREFVEDVADGVAKPA